MVRLRKQKELPKEPPSKNKESASYLVPAIVALIAAIITPFLTYQLGLRTQLEASEKQKKQQAHSELLGRKAIMTQLYVSRFEALIYSDYHEARWKLVGSPKDSIDLQEAQRWMHKSEDLVLEISKSNQSLFETLGLIRTSFRQTSELDSRLDHLYNFKIPQITKHPFDLNANQLENWKVQSVKQLQNLIEKEYSRPLDEISTYLAKEIAEGN
jgi:hypothetical protein